MLSFFSSFSRSFAVSLLVWPLFSLLLTLPILLYPYMKYRRMVWRQVVLWYIFVLYLVAVFFGFTNYPMPDDPQQYCSLVHITPNLIPFQFVFDILKDGTRAILQVVTNVILFVPLGIYLTNFFGFKKFPSLVIVFLGSLLIEVMQLTGFFSLYPCSYRLFDVDDLMLNTLGGWLGMAAGGILPDLSKERSAEGINHKPGLFLRFLVFCTDYLACYFTSAILVVLFTGKLTADTLILYNRILCGIFIIILPYFTGGQTLFAKLTWISIEDKPRTGWAKLRFYLQRAVFIGICLYAPRWLSSLTILVFLVYYAFKHRFPYD
ncbi:MAG: VanZ family protein [Erysipelotrichaceae bacterium]|jgi:glycopeptide antibiotics resistance protein|nr:VanZ family protein [Erysipelotrichaceae bacterium]